MSRGLGGSARMIMQDDHSVLYEYAPYNLNEEQYRNPDRIYDGVITISKSALVEPEIHEKIKKWPSGRKQLIVKRIPRDVDYDACFKAGLICIENSRFCWHILPGGFGKIAMHLIFRIFRDYQENGELPENIGYHV